MTGSCRRTLQAVLDHECVDWSRHPTGRRTIVKRYAVALARHIIRLHRVNRDSPALVTLNGSANISQRGADNLRRCGVCFSRRARAGTEQNSEQQTGRFHNASNVRHHTFHAALVRGGDQFRTLRILPVFCSRRACWLPVPASTPPRQISDLDSSPASCALRVQ